MHILGVTAEPGRAMHRSEQPAHGNPWAIALRTSGSWSGTGPGSSPPTFDAVLTGAGIDGGEDPAAQPEGERLCGTVRAHRPQGGRLRPNADLRRTASADDPGSGPIAGGGGSPSPASPAPARSPCRGTCPKWIQRRPVLGGLINESRSCIKAQAQDRWPAFGTSQGLEWEHVTVADPRTPRHTCHCRKQHAARDDTDPEWKQ